MTAATDRTEWRRIALAVYGPTLLVAIGTGAIVPLVALSARALGAGIGTAALVVALIGVGQLAGDLPAGALAARIGEKRALIGACVLEAVALVGAFAARSLVLLSAAVFVVGVAGAVFGLARHAYLTEAIDLSRRARALSTLGGTFRLGLFLGPFAAAILVSQWSLGSAYAFAGILSLAAAALTAALPELPHSSAAPTDPAEPPVRVWTVLRQHRRLLATLGGGVVFLSAARASRQSIIPLWADSQGLDATTISLLFGISASLDLLLFYPGGAIMDRYGRAFVAVPTMIVFTLSFLLLPLTHSVLTIGVVAGLMGLGNGISSGIVLTLGADAAPEQGRAQFLGGWRLCSDLGNAGGPLLISAVATVASLAAAAVALGLASLLGAGWLLRWIPRGRPSSRASGQALQPVQGFSRGRA